MPLAVYLTVEDILQIHRRVEPSEVLSNPVALEAAVASQRAGLAEAELFPDLAAKAAVLARGIAHGHPFSNGNKRVALLAVHLLVRLNGHAYVAGEDEAYNLIVEVATSRIDVETAARRIREHLFVIQ